MLEEWKDIEGFEGMYAVSNFGRVINVRNGNEVTPSFNKQKTMRVNLYKDGRIYNRSLSVLVCHTFAPPFSEHFNSAINLDGDRANNHIDNLVPRPRWFTVNYNRQFRPGYTPRWNKPIRDCTTGIEYPNSLVVSTMFGVLDSDVYLSARNRTFVFPTNQFFEIVDF